MAGGLEVQQGLEAELASVFTPSEPIAVPSQFAGRLDAMASCRENLKGKSVTFVVYGERGIGKTSFAQVLLSDKDPSLIVSSRETDFTAIFLTILTRLNQQFSPTEIQTIRKAGLSVGVDKVASVGLEGQQSETSKVVAEPELDLNLILDKLCNKDLGLDAIIIDEFDRIQNEAVRVQLLEVVKGLADRKSGIALVLVGTAPTYQDLLGKQPGIDDYIGRHIFPVHLGRMTNDELIDILVQRRSYVDFEQVVGTEIAWIAAGFPSNVHQLARTASLYWAFAHLREFLRRLSDLSGPVGWVARLLGGQSDHVSLQDVGVKIGLNELDRSVGVLADNFAKYHERTRAIVEGSTDVAACGVLLREIGAEEADSIEEAELAQRCRLTITELRLAAELFDGDVLIVEESQGKRHYRLATSGTKVYLRSLMYCERRYGGSSTDLGRVPSDVS